MADENITFILGPGGMTPQTPNAPRPVVEPGTMPSWLFSQHKWWIDPHGFQHRIDELSLDDCYGYINTLLTYSRRWREQWATELRETYDTQQRPRDWMIRQPIVRAFMARIIALTEDPQDA